MNFTFLHNLLASQFRKPSGLLGRYSAWFMTQNNSPKIQWAVDKCDIRATDTVLEIGFGPGHGIRMAAARATGGIVYGLDFSPTMVKKASRYNRPLIAAGKVRLTLGDLNPAPFADKFFDRIFAVNVVYFWPTPEQELSEIVRILKPGGKAVFYLSDRHSMAKIGFTNTGVFTKYTADEFRSVLSSCNFTAIESETRVSLRNGIEFTGHCFTATR
jgi:SAM-dependent methyltransferase